MSGRGTVTWSPDAETTASLTWLIPEKKYKPGLKPHYVGVIFHSDGHAWVGAAWYGVHPDGRRHQRLTSCTWRLDRDTASFLLPSYLLAIYDRWCRS